jgi:CelD/BcsL family acetyltransferase involved in cellulose biosynthesis
VDVVDDARGFDVLEQAWDALLARCDASVFQSFEWQRTWWRHFGEGRANARLHLVTVRDRRGLVAVAPLYLEGARAPGALRLRRMLLLGHRDADYLDVLAERGREGECARLVADRLAADRDGFDVLVLEDVPDRSAVAPQLRDALAGHGFRASRAVCERCPRTPLRPTWDETLAGFRRHVRHELRRHARQLAAEREVELEVVTGGAEVALALRELVEMHEARWARDGQAGALAERGQVAFQLDVAERLRRRGWLFLAFLRVDGRRCAASYGFAFQDALAIYLTAVRWDPALARHAPGRVLHARSMEWAVGAGLGAYDFMRGGERYKHDAFDAEEVPNWRVVAYPRALPLTRLRHRLHALCQTVRRRAWREGYALRRAAREDGWRSRQVRAHLVRAARRGWGDLLRVLRAARPARRPPTRS